MQAHIGSLVLNSGILVGNPPPEDVAIPAKDVKAWIDTAIMDADKKNITGAAVTPFLLERISQLSEGKSMQTNIALLKNNARLAANISKALAAANLPYI